MCIRDRYSFTFTEFAGEGENQPSVDGDTDFDEDGVGMGPIADLIPGYTGRDYDLSRWDPIQLLGRVGGGFFGL